MEEKKNQKLKVILIVGIIVILLVGATIAYFVSRQTGTATRVSAADLDITYTNESKFNIDEAITPLTESEILTDAPKVEFTVTNNSEESAYIEINMTEIILDKFKDYDFKWALYEEDTKLTTGSFVSEENSKITLAAGQTLAPSTPTVYTVYVWINETGLDQTGLMGGSFEGTIEVIGYTENNTLASKILSETIYTTPTFSTSSTDRGLFVQKDDSTKSNFGFPTYYYKGSTTNTTINSTYTMNNYVSFGTYKSDLTNYIWDETIGDYESNVVAKTGDPIIWRVVRINEDGSIRLISENAITNSGIYDDTAPYTPEYIGSYVETDVNNWYNSNIGSNSGTTLDNLVQTGNFCNDISGLDFTDADGDEYPDSSVLGNAGTRIENNTPIFTCPNEGAMLNSKVGLITADELVYAGFLNWKISNETGGSGTYIDNKTSFYTASPYDSGTIFLVDHVGSISIVRSAVDGGDLEGQRAVINLNPNVTVVSGNGSSSTPYVIG